MPTPNRPPTAKAVSRTREPTGIPRYRVIERDTITTVHRHILNTSTGEYEPDEDGPQPITWLLATVPDLS